MGTLVETYVINLKKCVHIKQKINKIKFGEMCFKSIKNLMMWVNKMKHNKMIWVKMIKWLWEQMKLFRTLISNNPMKVRYLILNRKLCNYHRWWVWVMYFKMKIMDIPNSSLVSCKIGMFRDLWFKVVFFKELNLTSIIRVIYFLERKNKS